MYEYVTIAYLFRPRILCSSTCRHALALQLTRRHQGSYMWKHRRTDIEYYELLAAVMHQTQRTPSSSSTQGKKVTYGQCAASLTGFDLDEELLPVAASSTDKQNDAQPQLPTVVRPRTTPRGCSMKPFGSKTM